jgi:hypothetical protein
MESKNELIAKFMGFEKTGHFYESNGVRFDKYKSKDFGMTYPAEWAFDHNWSWLIPVVEKIERVHDASYLCRIVSRRCIIYDSNIANQANVYQGSGEGIIAVSLNQASKQIAVYKAVVGFIEWYNSQFPSPPTEQQD